MLIAPTWKKVAPEVRATAACRRGEGRVCQDEGVEIGVGHLSVVPNTSGPLLLEWAKRAERLGFSTLATIDRIVYPSYDSLISLAAAAAVTSRIRLMTDILLGPTRNPFLLAKEAASVDQFAGGRLVLGLGVGARPDDYQAVATEFHDRGRRLDATVELMLETWRGEAAGGQSKPAGPPSVREGGVALMFGGAGGHAVRRTVRWGTGLTISGGTPTDRGAELVAQTRAAWAAAGRRGEPRFTQLKYFAMGLDGRERAADYLADYYGEGARGNAEHAAKSKSELEEITGRYEAMGVDEVVFFPTISDLGQIELLAEAAFG
ncbi:MAG: LLM class flavin-dependent oxidoreductase [Candidatus Dormibacteraceae bacterium]